MLQDHHSNAAASKGFGAPARPDPKVLAAWIHGTDCSQGPSPLLNRAGRALWPHLQVQGPLLPCKAYRIPLLTTHCIMEVGI